jgi:outer membrane protein TolC
MNALSLLIMLVTLALAGCAGFSHDGGFEAVSAATQAHLDKQIAWPRSSDDEAKAAQQVAALLAHPLSADDAVQVALLNNRALQAQFEELGISEADLVQSGRLPNPRFELRHASAAGQYDIEETLSFDVLSLLTMPYAHAIEKQRFARTQDGVILRVMQVAKETREAYIAAVAAGESVDYLRQVNSAAEASNELARRMVAAGNWNLLEQSRQQIFYSDALRSFTQAKLTEAAAREHLTRLMGLPGPSKSPQQDEQRPFALQPHLPELPQGIEKLAPVDADLLRNRIDLQMLNMQLSQLAHHLKLTKATRFINVLEAGPSRVRQGDAQTPYETGYVVSLEVPIFDSGAARVRKAEAIYAQAVDGYAQALIDARSQIRQAYASYQTSFDVAVQQRDQVVPLRNAVAQQDLLRYNASLISIFDLLADAREQAVGIDDYIGRVRDFWIAKSQLDSALLGNLTP